MAASALHIPITGRREPALTLAVSTDEQVVRVRVVGELDLATAPQFAGQLRTLIESGDEISLDLSRVRFIDLAGLRAVLDARTLARTNGKRLRIIAPSAACTRLFELTATTDLLS
jgi:anti-anti-sigma factor